MRVFTRRMLKQPVLTFQDYKRPRPDWVC